MAVVDDSSSPRQTLWRRVRVALYFGKKEKRGRDYDRGGFGGGGVGFHTETGGGGGNCCQGKLLLLFFEVFFPEGNRVTSFANRNSSSFHNIFLLLFLRCSIIMWEQKG